MNKYIYCLILGLMFGVFNSLHATHNRAGEIVFWKISGTTYGFKIVTYTKVGVNGDSPEVEVRWSDLPNDLEVVARQSKVEIVPGLIFRNVYTGTHVFPGPGTYSMSVSDPNRNEGIINLGGASSVDIPFFIESTLVISPAIGENASPILQNPPIDDACINRVFQHNPAAYDADGDSLAYELVPCKYDVGAEIPTYFTPAGLTIDEFTGTVTWSVPTQLGEFNIAILIKEYRDGQLIGTILRDMQFTVKNCNNNPPEIKELKDTCIDVGETLNQIIKAWDADGQDVTVEAFGAAFEVANNPPSFSFFNQVADTFQYAFSWTGACNHVRANSYNNYFIARDNDGVNPLTDIEIWNISIVGPSPINLNTSVQPNQITLDWSANACNEVIGYHVYRKALASGWNPSKCEIGVPAYTGFSRIGTVTDAAVTSFIDNQSLVHGVSYCYRVTAIYPDGVEGYASNEACNELLRDVPIISKVSVGVTDVLNGVDTVQWIKPFEIDTVNLYPGPYKYELYRAEDDGSETIIFTTPESVFLGSLDTSYIDLGLNTVSSDHTYRVVLYSNSILVGGTNKAQSLFLSLIPNDNELMLSWEDNTPWNNELYDVFKKNKTSGVFEYLNTTTNTFYRDTNLVNGVEECYYVRSKGLYSPNTYPDTIINLSQEVCGQAQDFTPPCAPPNLEVTGSCDLIENDLLWGNPNNTCSDDVVGYVLFASATVGAEMLVVDTIYDAQDTIYVHNFNNSSIAACYGVSALDSAGNLSVLSNRVCIDNCPEYELPNVFTPNGDGVNDLYIPVKNKFVEKVVFKVYNRWGQVIFETSDPQIKWNGKYEANADNLVSEGVYYYTCQVFFIKVTGLESVELTGNISVLNPIGAGN